VCSSDLSNIRECVKLLVEAGYDGVLSLECEGQGGPMLERSRQWVNELIESTIKSN
jgi:sugar phosphate isomerase/epimerase